MKRGRYYVCNTDNVAVTVENRSHDPWEWVVIMKKGERYYVNESGFLEVNVGYVTRESQYESLRKYLTLYETEEEKEEWKKFRRNAIVSFIQGILSNSSWPDASSGGFYKKDVVTNAISYADELIEKLKSEEL